MTRHTGDEQRVFENITSEVELQAYAPHLMPELPMPEADDRRLAALIIDIRAAREAIAKYRRNDLRAQAKRDERDAIDLMWRYRRRAAHGAVIVVRREQGGLIPALPPRLEL